MLHNRELYSSITNWYIDYNLRKAPFTMPTTERRRTHPEMAMAIEDIGIYKPNKKNIRYRDDGS